jgi:STE24 endopeptidase
MLLPFLFCILVLYVPTPAGTVTHPWPVATAGVAALALLNAAAGWAGSGVALRLSQAAAPGRSLAAHRVFTFLKGCLVGFVLADVFVLGWPAIVDAALAEPWWAAFVHDIVLLLPALVMALTLMAFQHRVEFRQQRVSLRLAPYLWLRFRVELGIVLVPWLALVLASAAVSLAFQGSELATAADAIASGTVVALLVVCSPLILRGIWDTSPLPRGPLRDRLEAFCRAHRFRCHEILVWHTHRHLANAGVAGPTPLVRYVMLTDALLYHCTEEEIEAAFAHEVGHIRHRHLLFYVIFGLAFVCFYANLVDLVALTGWVQPLKDILAFSMTAGQAVVMILFAALYWGLLFGFVSRRMEQQADLFALRSVGDPASFIGTLEKLAAMGGAPGGASSWRHFSMERRIGFLQGVITEPAAAARLQRRIAAIQAGLILALALGAARLLIARPELFGL